MRSRRERRHTAVFPQVLILTMLYLFGRSGDGARSLTEIVSTHVGDPDRAAAAAVLAAEAEELLGAGRARTTRTFRHVINVLEDYDTRSRDLEAALLLADAEWVQTHRRLASLRSQLKQLLDRKEWKAVMGEYLETERP